MLKSVDQGYAEAQYMIGTIYEKRFEDRDEQADLSKAASYFEKAAQQGNFKSQLRAGFTNYRSEDGPLMQKALFWHMKVIDTYELSLEDFDQICEHIAGVLNLQRSIPLLPYLETSLIKI